VLWGDGRALSVGVQLGVWNESKNRLTIFLGLFSSVERQLRSATCSEPSGLITGPAAVGGGLGVSGTARSFFAASANGARTSDITTVERREPWVKLPDRLWNKRAST
jgi:hypothetical protein